MIEELKIPQLKLQLKPYCSTGMFYIPKFLIQQGYFTIGKEYKLILEEVE